MSEFRFELVSERDGVRRGRYRTPHGSFETPCFAPVGTRAAMKGLTVEQVRATGSELILAPGGGNLTYVGDLAGLAADDERYAEMKRDVERVQALKR